MISGDKWQLLLEVRNLSQKTKRVIKSGCLAMQPTMGTAANKPIIARLSGGRRLMHITLGIAPVTKKNHQQIIQCNGRPLVIPSKQYKQYEKDCAAFIDALPFQTFDSPVNVECVYYMPTRRRVDLVNLQEATLDVLVKYGILLDDNANIVASMDGSKVLYDKENPRTEIEITEL